MRRYYNNDTVYLLSTYATVQATSNIAYNKAEVRGQKRYLCISLLTSCLRHKEPFCLQRKETDGSHTSYFRAAGKSPLFANKERHLDLQKEYLKL